MACAAAAMAATPLVQSFSRLPVGARASSAFQSFSQSAGCSGVARVIARIEATSSSSAACSAWISACRLESARMGFTLSGVTLKYSARFVRRPCHQTNIEQSEKVADHVQKKTGPREAG